MVKVHLCLMLGMVGLTASSGVANAQANPVAETLFRDGKRLIKEGKISEACTAFEGSERLEHNVSTSILLADCREREGKFATAWGLFLQVDSETRSDPAKAPLNEIAKKRAAALEGKLSYLTISVSNAAAIKDLEITRDHQRVDPAELNRAIPIDKGEHVIAGKAPGHEPWSTNVTVVELERKSVDVPKFKVLADVAPMPQPISTQPEAPASRFTARRKIALGVGGGSIAIAGIAVFLGASANSLRDEALARCPATNCSEDDATAAQGLNDRGRDRALYANFGFGVAGVAAITAVVLWFTGASESSSAIAIRPLTGPVKGFAFERGF